MDKSPGLRAPIIQKTGRLCRLRRLEDPARTESSASPWMKGTLVTHLAAGNSGSPFNSTQDTPSVCRNLVKLPAPSATAVNQ